MALTSTTLKPVEKTPEQTTTMPVDHAATVLAALVLSVYAAQKSKKQLRKLKRQALVTLFKHRVQHSFSRLTSLFSKKSPQSISNRTLLYILLGLAILILLFVEPIAAVVLLLLGILLVLLMK
jgi:hypothetical protein